MRLTMEIKQAVTLNKTSPLAGCLFRNVLKNIWKCFFGMFISIWMQNGGCLILSLDSHLILFTWYYVALNTC